MAARDRSARDLAYEELRTRIMTARLEPGQKVNEVELAAEIGASRTPIREALGQLAAEGFINVGRGGGYFVTGLDINEVQSLFEALLLLSRASAQLLVANATKADLILIREAVERFDAAVAEEDPALIAQRNYELHTLECRIGGNKYLTMLSERVHSHSQRLSYLSFSGAGSKSQKLSEHYHKTCIDHWQFLEAIEQNDLAQADAIVRRHIALFRSRVIGLVEADGLTDFQLTDLDGNA